MRKVSRRVRALLTTALIMFVITCALTVTAFAINGADKTKICEGVYVNDIDLGGLTPDQAEDKIGYYVDGITSAKVKINIDGRGEIETTLATLGLTADGTNCVEEAYAIGKKGNPIKRYKEVQDTLEKGVHYDITFSFKEGSIEKFLASQTEEFNIEPISASLTKEGADFVVSDHVVGRQINTATSAAKIEEYVLGSWDKASELSFDVDVEEVMPEFTAEDIQDCTTLLGTYTTDYSPVGTGRAKNVENGARLVNGAYMLPGDILSVDEKLRPYTVENGYGVGGQYVNGKVESSVGGGICQVSTTLYNAVLYAELEVVERAAHSMTVTYVPLSRDAAIAGDYKDFKFKNSSDKPIYIEGIARGGKITFNIYGHETRDTANRKVDFEYEILDTKKPGKDVVTEDPKKPKGYEEVTQGAFNGYTARLYKIVYENGKQVSKTQVNQSVYKSSPRYVTKGTGKPKKEEKEEEITDLPDDGSVVIFDPSDDEDLSSDDDLTGDEDLTDDEDLTEDEEW